MSKLPQMIRQILERPKCFSHLYYPYTKVEICNCVKFCKYGPPPAVMNCSPTVSLFDREEDLSIVFKNDYNDDYNDEKVA